MPPLHHPAKLIVLDPMYEVRDHRRILAGLAPSLIVEVLPGERFTFELRERRKLGPRSYTRCLIDLAADLAAGYTIAMGAPADFLDELEDLARIHAAAEREQVEAAAHTIAERSHVQVRDVLEGDVEHRIGRMLVFAREPRPAGRKPQYGTADSFNCIAGVPTPRSEQLWNSLRDEWCTVRTAQHAFAAWKAWARRRRRTTVLRAVT